MRKIKKVWCVMWGDGEWCACLENKKPSEGDNNVHTLCNYFIWFPLGFKKRIPTCRECLDAMKG
jgi:hypothetical protein